MAETSVHAFSATLTFQLRRHEAASASLRAAASFFEDHRRSCPCFASNAANDKTAALENATGPTGAFRT